MAWLALCGWFFTIAPVLGVWMLAGVLGCVAYSAGGDKSEAECAVDGQIPALSWRSTSWLSSCSACSSSKSFERMRDDDQWPQ